MKRRWLTLSALTLLAGLSGCGCSHLACLPGCIFGGRADCESCAEVGCDTCGTADCQSCGEVACDTCGGAGCQACGRPRAALCGTVGCRGCARCADGGFTPGPPSAAITYPYYTNRGPRDFLAENPPSIGP